MEFDEMKKIWDAQNNEPLYTINEKALHNRILSKKRQGYHITNVSELLWIIANGGGGCFILSLIFSKQNAGMLYFLAAWMLGTALYMLISRIRRIKRSHRFDRSMLGDLDHAISIAAYQIRLSKLGLWNILPIGILSILAVVNSGKSPWWLVALTIFFMLVMYVGARWEHRIYDTRKRELDALQNKLQKEG